MGPSTWEPTGVPWHPEHDGSDEHLAWARDYFDKTGQKCEECELDWAAKAAEEPQPAEPEQRGKFLIRR